MSTIRVVIDTSVLRGESPSGGPMEALARFAEQGRVHIFIPYVVADEYRTRRSSKTESLAELNKALKNLRSVLPPNLHPCLSEFEERIETEFDRVEVSARQRFDEWCRRTAATIVEPSPNQASKVLAKYFAGAPPFTAVKARQDIPDAFVVEAILELSTEGSLFVTTNDEAMINALNDVTNVTVLRSVKSLLDSETFRAALDESKVDAEHETANVERIVASFLQNWTLFGDTLKDQIGIQLAGRTVSYRNPHYDEKDGKDELYINVSEGVRELSFDGESDYLGEGVILVNFTARVTVDVDDPMSGEYYDDEGDPDTTREVNVSGGVTIALDPEVLQRTTKSWSGKELQTVASVSVDELYEIDLVKRWD